MNENTPNQPNAPRKRPSRQFGPPPSDSQTPAEVVVMRIGPTTKIKPPQPSTGSARPATNASRRFGPPSDD